VFAISCQSYQIIACPAGIRDFMPIISEQRNAMMYKYAPLLS
jgi:hypothetical protein